MQKGKSMEMLRKNGDFTSHVGTRKLGFMKNRKIYRLGINQKRCILGQRSQLITQVCTLGIHTPYNLTYCSALYIFSFNQCDILKNGSQLYEIFSWHCNAQLQRVWDVFTLNLPLLGVAGRQSQRLLLLSLVESMGRVG